MRPVRVLLAEDVHLIRGALAALLQLDPHLQVVASVGCGEAMLQAALDTRPDVAVIDIDLPGRDGLLPAGELHRLVPSCRTLILTSLGHPGTIRRALSARVAGFLLKNSRPDQLASSVRLVAEGQRVMDPQLALATLEFPENPLSPRELQVLRLASRGAGAAEIAGCLYLSIGTVRNYLSMIVGKLGARNRVDAVRIATDAGWIP